MARHATHLKIGVVAGATYAACLASDRSGATLFVEAIGGGIGGAIGAQLPDIFDPPTSPNHRSVAHAVLPNVIIFSTVPDGVKKTQKILRNLSDDEMRKSETATDEFDRFLHLAKSFGFCFLAGVIPGLAAGYLSHLALDATTPRGLPLVG